MSGLLDTQNKQWAEDKTKFGYRMMQKMGWTDGKGLGVKEDGATEHLRVRKKLTTAGVGAISSAREQWKVPAELASGLDDVLARLSAAAPVGAAARPAAGAVASGGDGARARGNKGFFGRRIAGKNVGAYSAEALREIFGGAPVAMAPRAIAAAEGESRKGGNLREKEEKKGRNEVGRRERAKRKEERATRREEKMLRRARRAEKERSKLGVARDGPGISKERKSSKKKGRRKGEDGK